MHNTRMAIFVLVRTLVNSLGLFDIHEPNVYVNMYPSVHPTIQIKLFMALCVSNEPYLITQLTELQF